MLLSPTTPGVGVVGLDVEEHGAELDGRGVLDRHTSRTVPISSAAISFMSFMASTMHSVWLAATSSPTFTNGGSPGAGAA